MTASAGVNRPEAGGGSEGGRPPSKETASSITSRQVVRYRGQLESVSDDLVVEEPMEIRMGGEPIAVIMRTPGHDDELALGFAITEGIVSGPGDVAEIRDLGEGRWELALADGVSIDPEQFRRNFYSTSSCGVCGKASIDAIRVAQTFPPPGPEVPVEAIVDLPERLLERQSAFHATGGLHAAGAFLPTGEVVAVREDVGRHNATDKLVGALARQEWPVAPMGLMVSGRVSFEIVQKAAVAGLPIVCGVSAASSLAVDLAEEFGMTLIGFLREGVFTVYTDVDRIKGL